jgi:hypothetical protein
MRDQVKPTAFLLLLIFLAGCSSDADTGNGGKETETNKAGYDSPQAAFDAMKVALSEDDWKTAASCMDEASQDMLAGGLVFGVAFMVATDEDKQKKAEKLLKKHGLDPNEEGGDDGESTGGISSLASAVKDKPTFIADFFEFIKENTPDDDFDRPREIGSGTLTGVKADGAQASGTVKTKGGKNEQLEFRKIDGRWFVHLPEKEFGMGGGDVEVIGGSDLPSDDENFNPFDNDDDDKPALLSAVDVTNLETSWKVDFAAEAQPAGELLLKLAGDLGVKYDADELDAEIAKTPVTIDLKGVSRLYVIEEVCRLIGGRPEYDFGELAIRKGPRVIPAIAAGPFVIGVATLKENVPHATGTLGMQFRAADLPGDVAKLLSIDTFGSDAPVKIELTEAVDADQNSLLDEGFGGGAFGDKILNFDRQQQINLKNLLKKVDKIATVWGSVTLTLPTKVGIVKFDSPKKGEKQTLDGIEFILEHVKEVGGGSTTVQLKAITSGDKRLEMYAYDSEGELLSSFGGGSFGSDDETTFDNQFKGKLATLEVRIVTEQKEFAYPFELASVPLPLHDRMPEKLAEITFKGDAPLAFEFIKIKEKNGSKQLVFDVTNTSNKSFKQFQCTIEYFDQGGKSLKTSPHGHSFTEILPGKSERVDISAFFMPDNAKSTKATVGSVRFIDATTWKKPDKKP